MTQTDKSLTPWGDATAVAAGEQLLAAHPGTFQNIHVMGWGSTNPEPSPGSFVWSDLDRRLAQVQRTGGTPVVTLCCAPDWMKGGAPGVTDWSLLEKAPLVEHFRDYAELARQVALRYPQVQYFQVWNEMKGFHDAARNRWRYEDYTILYNLVYDAVKSANPTAKIGGPYVVMRTWAPGKASHPSTLSGPWGVVDQRALDVVTYWLANAHGADFIAVDGGTAANGTYLVPPSEGVEKFAAINTWLRARTSLPIWWSELYPVSYDDTSTPVAERTLAWTRALDRIAETGGSVALLWQPDSRTGGAWLGLWTDTSVAAGGQRTAVCSAICSRLRGP